MNTHDATLRLRPGTRIVEGQRLSGRIEDDKLTTGNHPFSDGTSVSTSPVVSLDEQTGIVVTRSGTRYLIRQA